jgi:small subunit ribosomal protein S6
MYLLHFWYIITKIQRSQTYLVKNNPLCYTSPLLLAYRQAGPIKAAPKAGRQGGIILKPYEAIIIFNSVLPEDKRDASILKFEKKIKDAGGIDINTEKWGMKKLASPMKSAKKSSEGFYVLINFNSEGRTPNELKSLLNVSEEVIRYSVICSKPAEKEEKAEKVEIEPSMIMPQAGQGDASA